VNAELTIAIAQTNPTVGAIEHNLALIRDARARAAQAGADLVVFSELVVVGYPTEDLVLKPALQDYAARAVQALAKDTASGPAIIVGTPWRDRGKLYNAMLLLRDGKVVTARYKHDLPNYGVFDEKRVFAAGPIPGPMAFPLSGGSDQIRIGGMVCEDMWTEDVAEGLQESGAEVLIVPNGSPFEADKQDVRMNLAVARVTETGLPLIYCNQVGGQDELVFDGASFVLNADRRLVAQAKAFEEDLLITRWRREGEVWACVDGSITPPVEGLEAVYRAMCLGLRDYVHKNGFPGVVLGLSGGIDSALSAAVAVDALGAQRVHAVMMPSRYTSDASTEDAQAVARALGIRLDRLPIEPAVAAFGQMLEAVFAGMPPDITEENLQARIRGVLLMAISNKLGSMLLTTGNKSEMSVGYATLYGDMCGGYSVLKDVYKTTVFALSRWRNQHLPAGALGPAGTVIPERVITRPPSAELRADQTDQDSLPPYDVLDAILHGLVETDLSARDLVEQGFDAAIVRTVSNLLDIAEYKRRQAPPGVKITRKAFGRDRRYPITNAFRRIGVD
jgi:NAD+ synthase